MAELDFPLAAASPWTDPNGVTWTHDGDGWLKAVATHTHVLDNITDSGTAAELDYPAAGDAAVGELVKGDDTRLTDDRDPTTHNNTAHSATYIVAADVTYGNLSANGDIGAGSTQVAQGDHTHDLSAYATLDDAVAMAIALG